MISKVTLQNSGRLDALLAESTGLSRGLIQKLIACGGVKMKGAKALKPSQRVAEGEIVYLSKKTLDKIRSEANAFEKLTPEKINFDVAYEDQDILVVNKPVGLVVHPAHACPSGTLLNGVAYYLKINEESKYLPRPINRIDKDTSGLVLIAKTEKGHTILSRQFENRKVEKRYKAVVFGDFRTANCPNAFAEKNEVSFKKDEKGLVDYGTFLARSKLDRRRVVVAKEGRWALSRFRVEKVSARPAKTSSEPLSLLEIQILTGRTHQIRAQLKSLGFTIVGDPMYSNKRFSAQSKQLFEGLRAKPRMLLHSWRINVSSAEGKPLMLEAPLPKLFQDVLEEEKTDKT